VNSNFNRFARYCSLGAVLTALAWPVQAEAPPDLYRSALNRIENVYLWRDSLEMEAVLEAVAAQIEADIEWAMVEVEPDRLTLYHGGGQRLGEVKIRDWEALYGGLVALESVLRNADAPIDDDLDLEVVLLRGVADALDRHSRVLYGEKLKSFDKRLKGTLSGIGARIGVVDNAVLIKEIYAETPAYKGGLQSGDRLVRIDDVSTVGMSVDDAVNRITGPKGSEIQLQVERDTPEGPILFALTLVRDEIKLPNLSWRPLENGIGYVAIDHFSEQTVANLEIALAELARGGALENGLVLDLRDNTGGSMIQSARVADQFLHAGTLLRTEGWDGEPVSGLVSKIKAQDTGREPDVPIVILQNHRTASGSEIVAGALRELNRAVLIGTRSYGKGTVQKVYTLGSAARLKLTVAQYLLPGGLSVRDVGLSPDLEVGKLVFDYNGVRQLDGDEGNNPLLFVDQRAGWKTGAEAIDRGDTLEALAVRVLTEAKQSDRGSVLSALDVVSAEARAEEEAALIEAFDANNIDWTPATVDGIRPDVEVELYPEANQIAGARTRLRAKVTNMGDTTLHRVVVRLDSEDGTWRDRVLPVGKLAPGQTSEGVVQFPISPGRMARAADVTIQVEADKRPPVTVTPAMLEYEADPPPVVDLKMTLTPKGDAWEAGVTLENEGDNHLYNVSVRFEYPESAKVELTRYDAVLSALAPGKSKDVKLGLKLLDDAATVPLVVHVKADSYGKILEWPVEVSRTGEVLSLSAPRVEALDLPTSADAGTLDFAVKVKDDRRVDHLVVWSEGEKVAYASGDALSGAQPYRVPLEVLPGDNRYTVYATDDQGLRTRVSWHVRGVSPVTTDAAE